MRQPTLKAFVFFIGVMGVGYALATPIMTAVLGSPITPTSLANLTAFAILFAVLMTIWLDKPLELELFKWPEKRQPPPQKPVVQQPKPVELPVTAVPAELTAPQTGSGPEGSVPPGALFPHETPTDHWDVDFGDSKQVYQGTDLPVWILAGWAVFIIWAVVYLISGLPAAF